MDGRAAAPALSRLPLALPPAPSDRRNANANGGRRLRLLPSPPFIHPARNENNLADEKQKADRKTRGSFLRAILPLRINKHSLIYCQQKKQQCGSRLGHLNGQLPVDVLLVLLEAALQVRDRAVLDHPQLLADEVDQPLVVRNEHHAALQTIPFDQWSTEEWTNRKFVQGGAQRVHRFDVQMIRRLVQNQVVRSAITNNRNEKDERKNSLLQSQARERQSRLLTAGKRFDRLENDVAGETETTQRRPVVLLVES